MSQTDGDAFVGRVKMYRGDGGSPEAFSVVCAVAAMSGIGQKNEQQESTTFCSGGFKEYIAGLADGSEVTWDLNLGTRLSSWPTIRAMINDVKAKAIRTFEVRADGNGDGVDDVVFMFAATCLSWNLSPNVSAKNTISFGCKISGDITIDDSGVIA
jgi:hypothetical protein